MAVHQPWETALRHAPGDLSSLGADQVFVMTNTTRIVRTELEYSRADALTVQPALAVVWAAHEWERVGEVLLVPHEPAGETFMFGRHSEVPEKDPRRLNLRRQQPGKNLDTGSPANPYLSRRQLEICHGPTGTLRIENVGRLKLKVNGVEVDDALVRPGDLIDLKSQLLFLCVMRSQNIPPFNESYPLNDFGQADGYGLVGESDPMWTLRRELLTKGARGGHTLVLGQSGTGKELVARAVACAGGHETFVAVAAPDIAEGLFEAELFGNIANYPHHGSPARLGLIGEANGKTLILDELGEIRQELQARLLRVMETGEYHRLGQGKPERSDFRLVGATNRGKRDFRPDLWARFRDKIEVPPLNARREDIPLLATHLVRRMAEKRPALAARFLEPGPSGGFPRFSSRLMSFLVSYSYELNVRELETLLLEAIDASESNKIDLPGRLRKKLEAQARNRQGQGKAPVTVAIRQPLAFEAELDPSTLERLALFRRANFSATTAIQLGYPHTRTAADQHITLIVCLALRYAVWNVDKAAQAMAGPSDVDLVPIVGRKIADRIQSLKRKLEEESPDEVTRKLKTQFRGRFEPVVAPVVHAIRTGRLRLSQRCEGSTKKPDCTDS